MSPQELFDAAYTGIMAQGEQAMAELGIGCRYRAQRAEGRVLKCAIGMVILDDRYSPGMEGGELGDVLRHAGIITGHDRGDDQVIALARAIQTAHDTPNDDDFLPEFQWGMARVADMHGLDTTVLEGKSE